MLVQWLIILDESGLTERLRVLTAALWYRGRAIPLAWVCSPGQAKQTVSYWARCEMVLAQVASLVPQGAAHSRPPIVAPAGARRASPWRMEG